MTYKVKATIENEKGVRYQTTLLFSTNLTSQIKEQQSNASFSTIDILANLELNKELRLIAQVLKTGFIQVQTNEKFERATEEEIDTFQVTLSYFQNMIDLLAEQYSIDEARTIIYTRMVHNLVTKNSNAYLAKTGVDNLEKVFGHLADYARNYKLPENYPI